MGKVAFIGGGNMGAALIGGLLRAKGTEGILVSSPSENRRRTLSEAFPQAEVTADNRRAAAAPVIVLAVKPQQFKEVAADIKGCLSHRPLVISVMAGIPLEKMQQALGEPLAIVRAMPNTPALLGCAISALCANGETRPEQAQRAEAILACVGETVWLEHEEKMDAVTAISGSGPAYFFLITEILEKSAQALGLEPAMAGKLARQTALGAGRMMAEARENPRALRKRVTSPGGTTACAVKVLEEARLEKTFAAATAAAAERARALAQEA